MSNQSLEVLDRLTRAAQSGLLPADEQAEAERLLARMQQPVRLALLGTPSSGKSLLLNLLAGSDVLPEGVRLPTLQLRHGPEEQAICTLADGTKKTFPTANAHAIAALSPVFVEMELPLPALAKISLLEIVAPNDPNALHRASQWAAKRADVVLWCTSEFDKTERRIWGQMPDVIKDHALMLVTHMDVLQEEGTLDGVIGSIRTAAIGEFEIPIGQKYKDDLRTIFIVSEASLMNGEKPDEIYKSLDIEGLSIRVEPTSGEKCERCWIHDPTVGQDKDHPTICNRCLDVLDEIQVPRKMAAYFP